VQRALRQAQLYGHLVARHGRLYQPGGGEPLCGPQTSKEIVRAGWLRFRRGKYVITPEGLRVVEEAEGKEVDAPPEKLWQRRAEESPHTSDDEIERLFIAAAKDNKDFIRQIMEWGFE
jgi:hypothetical protein